MLVTNEPVDVSEPFPIMKTSVKWLEIPIQKFNTAVPHFVELLTNHHNNVTKLKRLNHWEELQREHTSASITVNQLTSLLGEIDGLRSQVIDADLSKFDKLISSSTQSASRAIQSYQDFPVQSSLTQNFKYQDLDAVKMQELQDQKLQIVADLTEEIQIQEQHGVLMERILEDIEDVHCLLQDVSQLVHHQGESVEKVEEHVEKSHHNVLDGERMLCQAAKYKNGMYPLIGALIGSVVGGPIGLLAGFKLGGITAVGCGLLGFTGGKMLKNQNEVIISDAEHHRQELTH